MDWVEYSPYYNLRVFKAHIDDGILQVLVGREPIMQGEKMGWHLSIAHVSKVLDCAGQSVLARLPSWEEIKEARYKFCPDNLCMAMILPPKSEYVNLHPTTMHLYEIVK